MVDLIGCSVYNVFHISLFVLLCDCQNNLTGSTEVDVFQEMNGKQFVTVTKVVVFARRHKRGLFIFFWTDRKDIEKTMKMNRTKKLTVSSMLFALGLVLPFLTGQIPQIGSMLLPMHIPVFLCGLICGGKHGAMVGLLVPLVRSILFGMPPMFPTATAMAFELGTYGAIAGVIYFRAGYFCMKSLYKAMLMAMVAGRVVWAVVMMALMGISGGVFTIEMFLAGAFLNAIPGIAVQLVLIPGLMLALGKTRLIPFGTAEAV